MAEYIERESLEQALNERVEALRRMYGNRDAFADGYDDCIGRVEGFPSAADVAPVVHGRWIITKEYNDIIEMDVMKYTCSACGEYRLSATTLSQATNYCPNCGARMDKEKEPEG